MKDYQEGENPDKTQKRYLLNTNSKKIHDLEVYIIQILL